MYAFSYMNMSHDTGCRPYTAILSLFRFSVVSPSEAFPSFRPSPTYYILLTTHTNDKHIMKVKWISSRFLSQKSYCPWITIINVFFSNQTQLKSKLLGNYRKIIIKLLCHMFQLKVSPITSMAYPRLHLTY